MNKKSKIHFEVSERKILLRIFDVVFVVWFCFESGFVFFFFQAEDGIRDHFVGACSGKCRWCEGAGNSGKEAEATRQADRFTA